MAPMNRLKDLKLYLLKGREKVKYLLEDLKRHVNANKDNLKSYITKIKFKNKIN